MNKKIFFTIPGIVTSFLSFIMVLVPGFYQHRSVSSSNVAGHYSSSKGSYYSASCFDATPALGVFLVLLTLAMLGLTIATLASRKSKVGMILRIVLIIHVCLGIITFFIGSCALSTSSTSGISGAWSSSGESWTFGPAGWLYFVFSVLAVIFGFVGSTAAEK